MRVVLHDVPENRAAADLDHRFWSQLCFFGQTCTQSTGENDDFHLVGSPTADLDHRFWYTSDRRNRAETKTDGRDRRPPDSLAHHEALRASRLQGVFHRA